MPNFLKEEDVLSLRLAHRKERDKKLADRIKAILMLNSGFTYDEIVRALLLDEATLRRYLKTFQKKGAAALLELHYIGHKSKLTLFQELTLKNYLRDNTKRTVKEISNYIQKTYGVEYLNNRSN